MEREVLHTSTVTTSRARQGQRGFTLVELALVVAIIGILAVIALVGYRRYMLHSKMTEAKAFVGAIKIAQEDYRAEKGSYANLGTQFCPNTVGAGTGNKKVGWNPSCSGGSATWETLAVHVAGAVHFQYRTAAGTGAYADPFSVTWVTGTANIVAPWYVVHARSDLDDDGGDATELWATSYDNQIFTHNDGN